MLTTILNNRPRLGCWSPGITSIFMQDCTAGSHHTPDFLPCPTSAFSHSKLYFLLEHSALVRILDSSGGFPGCPSSGMLTKQPGLPNRLLTVPKQGITSNQPSMPKRLRKVATPPDAGQGQPPWHHGTSYPDADGSGQGQTMSVASRQAIPIMSIKARPPEEEVAMGLPTPQERFFPGPITPTAMAMQRICGRQIPSDVPEMTVMQEPTAIAATVHAFHVFRREELYLYI